MYFRQKSYQLHTLFVATYTIPLVITTPTQDLEPTSQAATKQLEIWISLLEENLRDKC